MTKSTKKAPQTCQICGSDRASELRPGILVRPAVAKLILEDRERWDENGLICLDDLQRYRHKYVASLLLEEKGEITQIEEEVLESLREQEILARNPESESDAEMTFGQRLADRIATFGGSWTFISIFGVVIVFWMLINIFLLAAKPFDPYPFILLNLVLSCLAALQAPVIMMSQNRQESRDRARATHDYQINLKAELEIRHLHQKMDHLLSHQWQRLVEIQDIQMELIQEVRSRR
jgi:uncharacterized membrane protein